MKILCVPDSFKGSSTAAETAAALACGAREIFPDAHITELPFADGGEGTLQALLSAWGTEPLTVKTTDAIGRNTNADFGLSHDGTTAVIEAAEANGLPQVSDVPLQPRQATTRGVGKLIRAALDEQVEEILLCIGGSATTDGGTGILSELGVRFLDAQGQTVTDGGAGLNDIASIDVTGLDPRVHQVRWRIAVDVLNPLTGEKGAAAVFGPQKGAQPDDVEFLDAGLVNLATRLADLENVSATAQQLCTATGYGAAGGIPVTMVALLGAEILPGGQMLAETLGLDAHLAQADLVLTGEGRFDSQSLNGKVIDTIASRTPDNVPVVVIAGSVELTAQQCRQAGVTAAFSIAQGPATLENLSQNTAQQITDVTAHACAVLAARR